MCATSGISAAPRITSGRPWMIQCHHAGDSDATLAAYAEEIDAPIGFASPASAGLFNP